MTDRCQVPGTPRDIRALVRAGKLVRPTCGMAPGFVQANLVILPRDEAFDFLIFCQRNPKPCPLLEVLDAGCTEPVGMAPGSDLRTDVGKYRVYRDGSLVDEPEQVIEYWHPNLVSFLLGCSFTFEAALLDAGIPVRHIEQQTNVPMFVTSISTTPAGRLSGPLVVTMRPIPRDRIVRAVQVTSRFPGMHGAPVHIGQPEAIGIADVNRPDLGDAVRIGEGEVPVFWACGVTAQAVAMKSRPPLMITHSPGYMFVTDKRDADYAVL
jgi:uncharacterized protein YcsI (UPF0317 family)